ncbi:polyprenyl synthetase family protein [Halalkalibacillus halophilus]|uniref:polyprenyl synthetase family protein n=1 Tax=Halalkalibacillus halophilus TaxID=392827 RepID=UPI0004046823|nr:farnesyl diphosphate synthase [Halalkalibacillus halophilus]
MKDTLFESKRNWINEQLEKSVSNLNLPLELNEALIYTIEAGGKRLRPILMLSTFQAFGEVNNKVIEPAIALEMIHTYSLVHDDLPSMDDDDLRRGNPTIHKKFDEATAVLIGDGLLTYAFQIISGSSNLGAEEKVYIIHQLSKASGFEGMIAGQFMDLRGEGKELEESDLTAIHQKKTGELISASVKIGAYLGGANPPQIEALNDYAEHLGLIFQIQDDILDVKGKEEVIGKPVGSDEALNKSTYPKIIGLAGAEKKRDDCMVEAKEAYSRANIHQPELLSFIDLFGNRMF